MIHNNLAVSNTVNTLLHQAIVQIYECTTLLPEKVDCNDLKILCTELNKIREISRLVMNTVNIIEEENCNVESTVKSTE